MNRIELNPSAAIKFGWELSKKYGLLLAFLFFLVAFIPNILDLFFFPWGDSFDVIFSRDPESIKNFTSSLNRGPGLFSSFLTLILTFSLQLGILANILRITRQEADSVSFSAYHLPLMVYFKYVVANVLCAFLIAVGLCFCILPGIYIALRLSFVSYLIIDRPEDSLLAAFKNSCKMTGDNEMDILILFLLFLGINLLGLLCCYVGVFFTVVISNFALAKFYVSLLPKLDSEEENSNYMR